MKKCLHSNFDEPTKSNQAETVRVANHFLHDPLFVPSRLEHSGRIEGERGLVMQSKTRLPNATDKKMLMALVSLLPEDAHVITVSGSQLMAAQGRKGGLDADEKKRLRRTLQAWKNLKLSGRVGSKNTKLSVKSGVIKSYRFRRGKWEIFFDKEFLKRFRPDPDYGNYQLINVDEYNALRSPLAVRLFEWLTVQLSQRDSNGYGILIPKFEKSMGKGWRNNADMHRDIGNALREIKEQTGKTFRYETTKNNRLIFKTLGKSMRDEAKQYDYEEKQIEKEEAEEKAEAERQEAIANKKAREKARADKWEKEKKEYREMKKRGGKEKSVEEKRSEELRKLTASLQN